MITDRLENHTLYPYGNLWKAAFNFLKTVTPETECGTYKIQGDDLFVIVDSYDTKARDDAKLETHRKYADIQVLLSGSECFEVFPGKGLTVSEPYNPEKDAEFYQVPVKTLVKITMEPGRFIVFLPEDAHMPCLMTGSSPQPVKKAVIKVNAAALR